VAAPKSFSSTLCTSSAVSLHLHDVFRVIYVAINDYAGSDYTRNLVYSVDKNEPPIDLQKQLDRGLSEHGQELPEADHLYMSGD